jgi:hypothetical protein
LGRVFSLQAGQVVSHERDIGGEWTHIAAIRRGRNLELFINGKLSTSSPLREGAAFNVSNDSPLWIGFGAQNYFHGTLSDLRWYGGALSAEDVRQLANRR